MILDELRKPEYVHVLLNPLPVYGTAMGVIALIVALVTRSRPAQIAGLIIVLIGCGSVWPVVEFGEKGYDRVRAMSNPDGEQWLAVHADRAHDAEWFFYVTAATAAAALAVAWKWPKVATILVVATLALAVASVAVAGWIGHAGGQVRHTEFRTGPPPAIEHEH